MKLVYFTKFDQGLSAADMAAKAKRLALDGLDLLHDPLNEVGADRLPGEGSDPVAHLLELGALLGAGLAPREMGVDLAVAVFSEGAVDGSGKVVAETCAGVVRPR